MENLLSKAAGPEFLYRYLLLSELEEGAEPFAATALMRTLAELGSTEVAVKKLMASGQFDSDYTGVLYGIAELEGALTGDTEVAA